MLRGGRSAESDCRTENMIEIGVALRASIAAIQSRRFAGCRWRVVDWKARQRMAGLTAIARVIQPTLLALQPDVSEPPLVEIWE